MTPSTYMVVLQGALQGKRCKIVANKVGWKFVDIVAQNHKKIINNKYNKFLPKIHAQRDESLTSLIGDIIELKIVAKWDES